MWVPVVLRHPQWAFKRDRASPTRRAGWHTFRHAAGARLLEAFLRHQDSSGFSGTKGCQHDDVVHPCVDSPGMG